MKNMDIRAHAKEANIKLWEIGDQLGMTDSTFSRKLRRELDQDTKNQIISIIDNLKQASGQN